MKTYQLNSNNHYNVQLQQASTLNQHKSNPTLSSMNPQNLHDVDALKNEVHSVADHENQNNEQFNNSKRQGGAYNYFISILKSWFGKEENLQQQIQPHHQQFNRQGVNLLENHPCTQSKYVKMRESLDELNCQKNKQSNEIVRQYENDAQNKQTNLKQNNINKQDLTYKQHKNKALINHRVKANKQNVSTKYLQNINIPRTLNSIHNSSKNSTAFSMEQKRLFKTAIDQQQKGTNVEKKLIDNPTNVCQINDNIEHTLLAQAQQSEKVKEIQQIDDIQVKPLEQANKEPLNVDIEQINIFHIPTTVPELKNDQKYFFIDGQLQANLEAMDDEDLKTLIENYINEKFIGGFWQNPNSQVDKIKMIEQASMAAQKERFLQRQRDLQQQRVTYQSDQETYDRLQDIAGDCATEIPDNENNGRDQSANNQNGIEAQHLTSVIQQDNIKDLKHLQEIQLNVENQENDKEQSIKSNKQADQDQKTGQSMQIQNQLQSQQKKQIFQIAIQTKESQHGNSSLQNVNENNQEAVEAYKLQQASSKPDSEVLDASIQAPIPQFINNICANQNPVQENSKEQIIFNVAEIPTATSVNQNLNQKDEQSEIKKIVTNNDKSLTNINIKHNDDDQKPEIVQSTLPTTMNIFAQKPIDVNTNVNIFEQSLPTAVLQQQANALIPLVQQQQQTVPFSIPFSLQVQDNPFSAASVNFGADKLPITQIHNINLQKPADQLILFPHQNLGQSQINQNNIQGQQCNNILIANQQQNPDIFNTKNDYPFQTNQEIPLNLAGGIGQKQQMPAIQFHQQQFQQLQNPNQQIHQNQLMQNQQWPQTQTNQIQQIQPNQTQQNQHWQQIQTNPVINHIPPQCNQQQFNNQAYQQHNTQNLLNHFQAQPLQNTVFQQQQAVQQIQQFPNQHNNHHYNQQGIQQQPFGNAQQGNQPLANNTVNNFQQQVPNIFTNPPAQTPKQQQNQNYNNQQMISNGINLFAQPNNNNHIQHGKISRGGGMGAYQSKNSKYGNQQRQHFNDH